MYAKQAQYSACLVLPSGKVGLRREIDSDKSTAVHVHAMKAWGGVGVYFHTFLTSVLNGGEWWASRTHWERASSTLWVRCWVGPTAGLDVLEKRKIGSPPPCSLVTCCLGFMFSFRLQAWFICVTVISRYYLLLDVRLISRSVWLEHIWCEDSGTDRRWLCAKCARNTTYTSLYPGSIIWRQNGRQIGRKYNVFSEITYSWLDIMNSSYD